MHARRKLLVRLVSCLLALLAAAQPAIGSICLCPCRCSTCSLVAGGPQPDCEHDHHCHNACNHHCSNDDSGSAHTNQEPIGLFNWLYSLGLRPCECPADCDCQLLHGDVAGLLRNSDTGTDSDHGSTPVAECQSLLGLSQPDVEVNRSIPVDAAPPDSAMALCAALCRFLA